jgi:hypothetical protein
MRVVVQRERRRAKGRILEIPDVSCERGFIDLTARI